MLTWIEIDGQAIKHNIDQFRTLVGKDYLMMPVIKANAYGHGLIEIAKICHDNQKVDRLCVVNSAEALQLVSQKLTNKPIQILSFYDFELKKLQKLAKNNVVFPLYTLKQAKLLDIVGESNGRAVKVHLKLDTGTTRIGVLPENIEQFITDIKKCKNLNVEGIFSHFSSSEKSREVTLDQLKLFKQLIISIEKQLDYQVQYKHISCSAATILYDDARFNAVRFGLSLYGLHPSVQTNNKINLRPALSWKTTIIQLKKVPKDTKVGYDQTYNTKKNSTIAVLPVGYWDGLDRRLSNKGHVLVGGIKCPIVGNICMNLTMVDVSAVKKVKAGDIATLIGTKGNQSITVEDMATWADTINYEIIDRINPLLPRIVK